MKYRYFFIFLLVWLLGINSVGLTKEEPIDFPKMKRDLNIMKGILDQLMNPQQSGTFFTTGNTRAIYLEGNGVIFIYQYAGRPDFLFAEPVDEAIVLQEYDHALSQYVKATSKMNVSRSARDKKRGPESHESFAEKIKPGLFEFLGDYCDAIKQLKPNENVSVVVLNNWDRYQAFQRLLGRKGINTSQLIGTVMKADITEYRRENLSKEDFEKRIHFETTPYKTEIQKEVQIMRTIFDTVLQENLEDEFALRGETWATYLKNFGALFVINLRDNYLNQVFQIQTDENKNSYRFFINQFSSAGQDNRVHKTEEEKLEKIKITLVDILAGYGHTLRRLERNEWIGAAVELNGMTRQTAVPSILFVKVLKRYVDEFENKRINRSRFEEQIVITEY